MPRREVAHPIHTEGLIVDMGSFAMLRCEVNSPAHFRATDARRKNRLYRVNSSGRAQIRGADIYMRKKSLDTRDLAIM